MSHSKTRKYSEYPRLIILIFVSMWSATVVSSQENFDKLLDAIESNQFEVFEELLLDGADPNFIGEGYISPIYWVNCLAARTRSKLWLETIEKFGGNLSFVRPDYAANRGDTRYASALFCSIYNPEIEAFEYLIDTIDDPQLPLCHLCEPRYAVSILDVCVRMGIYEKAAWLLENTDFAKDMINERIVFNLNRFGGRIKQERMDWYWKTVDLVRSHGHDVTPEITR